MNRFTVGLLASIVLIIGLIIGIWRDHPRLFGMVVALIGAVAYVSLWMRGPLGSFRSHLSERGEASLTLTIITVALLAGFVALAMVGKHEPLIDAALPSLITSIVGGELAVHRLERRKGQAIAPARATRKRQYNPDATP